MEAHDGEALEKMIKDARFKVVPFAAKMGVQRSTIYRWIGMPRLSTDDLTKAATILGTDLKDYIPRFARKSQSSTPVSGSDAETSRVSDERAGYATIIATTPNNLDDCRAQLLHWQGKAYHNLEQYTKLLQLYMDVVKKLPEGTYPVLSADGQVLFPQNSSN